MSRVRTPDRALRITVFADQKLRGRWFFVRIFKMVQSFHYFAGGKCKQQKYDIFLSTPCVQFLWDVIKSSFNHFFNHLIISYFLNMNAIRILNVLITNNIKPFDFQVGLKSCYCFWWEFSFYVCGNILADLPWMKALLRIKRKT